MKTNLFQIALVATLLASPLANAVEPEKSPGKDSTSTTAPAPKTPAATDPAASTGSTGTAKDPVKEGSGSAPAAPKPGDGKASPK